MTQADFCKKYHVKPPYISSAIKKAGVKPIGRIQGEKKIQPDYEEKGMINALLAEYQRRFENATNEAGEWRKKAMEAKAIFSGKIS